MKIAKRLVLPANDAGRILADEKLFADAIARVTEQNRVEQIQLSFPRRIRPHRWTSV